jgi:hypothetical protein
VSHRDDLLYLSVPCLYKFRDHHKVNLISMHSENHTNVKIISNWTVIQSCMSNIISNITSF